MITSHEIAERVQDRLGKIQLGSITLKVIEQEIREEEDCWYVPVQPTSEPAKTSEYYEALAEVESSLLIEDDLNIFFIPTAPDE